jgi:methylthioribose-1-phosphate isomerase
VYLRIAFTTAGACRGVDSVTPRVAPASTIAAALATATADRRTPHFSSSPTARPAALRPISPTARPTPIQLGPAFSLARGFPALTAILTRAHATFATHTRGGRTARFINYHRISA